MKTLFAVLKFWLLTLILFSPGAFAQPQAPDDELWGPLGDYKTKPSFYWYQPKTPQGREIWTAIHDTQASRWGSDIWARRSWIVLERCLESAYGSITEQNPKELEVATEILELWAHRYARSMMSPTFKEGLPTLRYFKAQFAAPDRAKRLPRILAALRETDESKISETDRFGFRGIDKMELEKELAEKKIAADQHATRRSALLTDVAAEKAFKEHVVGEKHTDNLERQWKTLGERLRAMPAAEMDERIRTIGRALNSAGLAGPDEINEGSSGRITMVELWAIQYGTQLSVADLKTSEKNLSQGQLNSGLSLIFLVGTLASLTEMQAKIDGGEKLEADERAQFDNLNGALGEILKNGKFPN